MTRQAIYAIEAGTYMPNTAVALRLARVLDTSVEDLFALDEEETPAADVRSFEPLDDDFLLRAGRADSDLPRGAPGDRYRAAVFPAWLPVADGIVSDCRGHAAMAGEPDDANRLLIAGCDPALSLLARHAREAGIDVILASGNSARSLEWLRAGKIDIAGSHLNDPIAGGRAFSVVTFALWEEGFVVRRGNPKAIRSVADLANPRVRFVNREEGSGSRKLFDSLMEAAGMTAVESEGQRHQCARAPRRRMGSGIGRGGLLYRRRLRRAPLRPGFRSARGRAIRTGAAQTRSDEESGSGRSRSAQSRALPAAAGDDRGI